MKPIELRELSAPYATATNESVATNKPVVVEQGGKPVAVVVPFEMYQQITHAPATETKTATDEIFERNRAAYYAMKPELLKTHRGKWVAFHDGQFVDSDADESALVDRVHAKYKYGTLFIHYLDEPERIYHIPGPRLPRNQ